MLASDECYVGVLKWGKYKKFTTEQWREMLWEFCAGWLSCKSIEHAIVAIV
jgi:hypothetical protein